MAKEIVYSEDARQDLLQGMEILANTIKATLGPRGREVMIEKKWGAPVVTNDGATIAKELEVEQTCCLTGVDVPNSFCRFPDYVRGTMMVMCKEAMLEHLRAGDSVQAFKKVLVERHGPKVLEERYANY